MNIELGPRQSEDAVNAQNVVLRMLTALLDKAVAGVPASRYVWGIVALAAAAEIVNLVLRGLGRGSMVVLVAMFVGMALFFLFTRIAQAADDIIVKLAGQ